MKIKKLKLDNFAQFTDFECEFDGKITRLVGVNGSGKTTIGLTAIWAGFKGIAERTKDGLVGDRFRFIGSKRATADIEITIVDEAKEAEIIVNNHLSKQGNKITFEAPEDYPVDEAWLNNLLNVAFLSAKNFTQMDGKEQALALGIDVSDYNEEIASLKEEYTEINRDVRRHKDLEEPEKAEPVNVSDLIKEREEIREFNQKQKDLHQKKDTAIERVEKLEKSKEDLELRIEKLQLELKGVNESIKKGEKYLKDLDQPEEEKSTDDVDAQIQNAEETNRKANVYENYLEKKKEYDKAVEKLEENKEKQSEAEEKKLEYIRSFDFGFDGLEVDADGSLLLNERPIKEPYFSKGELEIIVAKLYASSDPELKVRFIDDFDMLDEDNQESLVKDLIDEGFQLITAEVGKEDKGDNTILLRECKHVESYNGKKKEALI